MNSDSTNNNDFNGTSLNNPNVVNPETTNNFPQEPVMQDSIPKMNESVIPSVESAPIVNEPAQNTVSSFTSEPEQTNSFGDMSNTTIQPNINVMSTPAQNLETSTNVETTKKSKGKNGILIAIIVILVALVAGVYVYLNFFGNISHKVYQTAIEKGIGNLFGNIHTDNAYQYDVSLSLNVETDDSVIPKEYRDLINNISLSSVIQIDKTNHLASIKLDSKYQSEDLLKANVFAELDKNLAYVSLPGILDKYIETSDADFSQLTETLEKKYDYKTIEKVLKREMVKIVKEDECSNENGYYIWKVSIKELDSRLANLLNTLKSDSEFVTAMGGKEEVERLFGSGLVTPDEIDEDFDITFKLNDKEYDVSFNGISIDGKINKDEVTYNVRQDGTSIANGSITVKNNNDKTDVKFSITSSQMGTISVSASSKYTAISSVENIDKTNVVKSNELTEEDGQAIMQKLQESKLYELISAFIPQQTEEQNDYNSDEYNLEY